MWEYVEEEEEEEKEEGCTRSDTATLTGIKNLLKQLERWLEMGRRVWPKQNVTSINKGPPPPFLSFFFQFLSAQHNSTQCTRRGTYPFIFFWQSH
jgi:hypothetical protein